MKKIITISIVLLIGLTQLAQAQLASFNFSSAASTLGGWRNVSGDPRKGVRTGTINGITISSVDTNNWVPNPSGNCAGNGVGAGGGFFPGGVQGNDWTSWCGWGYELSHYNAAAPQLRLTGLNKDSIYIIRMTGSDSYIGGNTQYTVSGDVNYGTQAINTYYNTATGATFFSVKPNVSGQVNVYVNSSPSGGALISGLRVYSGSTANIGAPTVTITAPATGYVAAQGSIILIKATAVETGQTIAKVEYFANSVKIGEVDTVPYTFTWVNPDTGHYQITVRATDNIGTPGSASINLAVLSLNNAIAAGDGLSMLPNGLSLGDSVTGLGPHSLHSNRYQHLNGHQYSFGGSVNDPVNHPVFRIYNNGDISAGTTMDTSVNTKDQIGMRYYAKPNILTIGASDRLDTTQGNIGYGIWPTSGIIINSDEPNSIKGKLMNTVFEGDANIVDSGFYLENNFIATEACRILRPTTYFIRTFFGGYGTTISATTDACVIDGHGHTINKPVLADLITGYQNATADTSFTSIVGGALNRFGGLGQLTAGQSLTNRTPYGAALGNGNIDFATLPYTGLRGTTVAGIAGYPLFSVGNSAANDGSGHSNAITVLYNGRTQINTTGHTTSLTQTAVTPQAALDVVSINTGVLLPRLTNAQRGAIAGADLQNGLLLYNTDSSVFQYYNGSAWNSVGSGSGTGGGRWLFSTGTGTTIYDSLDNIAIGTSDPKGYKLAVNGAAIVNSIKVKATSLWPDYVFHKGYVLPGLTDVERYILKNHHLPGIVSAAEVGKNGLDLGANQAAMLKKIEELTLYTIRQDKQVSELTSQVEDMKKEMEELKALIRGRQ